MAADSTPSDGVNHPPPPLGSGGSSEDLGVELAFDPADAVALAPREEHEITVVVTPPAAHTVRFALVDARDAALDQSSLVTDVTGRGSVVLTAPSTLGDFSLRAQLGSRSAVLSFSVNARDRTTLEVVPRYAGHRTVSEWVASAHIGRSCSDFGAVPKDALQLFARVAADKTAIISSVALGSPIAVTVRAAQFAGGCVDLSPEETRETIRVEVPVIDRPLDLEHTELDVAFAVAPRDATFLAAVDSGLSAVRSAFLGGATTPAPSALLDAMDEDLEEKQRAVFRAARIDRGWDTLLVSNVAGVGKLTDSIARWVALGQVSLLSQRAFEGYLSADPSRLLQAPLLRIDRVAELAASDVALSVSTTAWSADASDTLAFSGTVSWKHGQLITALARAPALAEGAADVPGALATVADCKGVSTFLVKGTAQVTVALRALCNADCLAAACRGALATMWERAAAEGSSASLAIAAAGGATIGNQAQATALQGNWVGKLTLEAKVGDTSGSVQGAAPRYSAR